MPTRLPSDRYTGIDYPRMREYRLNRTREAMKQFGIDVLITFEAWDIRYITGAYVPPAVKWPEGCFVVLPINGDPYLCAFSVDSLKEEMPWMKGKIFPQMGITKLLFTPEAWNPYMDKIEEIIKEHGLEDGVIGIDGSSNELIMCKALENRGFKKYIDAKECMFQARKIKNEDEITCIKECCAIAEAAFYEIKKAIKPGVTECEIMGAGMKKLYELGCDEVFEFVVSSGPRTNPIRIDCTDRIIRPGDIVFVDINGASFQGYKCCYYRSFVCGKATEEQKEVFREARDMMYAAMDKIKAGATTRDLCEVWPDSPTYWGYEPDEWDKVSPHAVGHGIGLSLHEFPLFSRPGMGGDAVLEEGMVLALETWCGKNGGDFGIRVEENVVVRKDGYELLTKFPIDELIECPF